jgi:ABC-type Fe3+/spermidine/putrescine transport system ATPase subunit
MVKVELRKITKRFGEVTAAGDVNLTIEDGEFFTLLGPSGCGKTTTMRIIAGLEFPDSGSVLFDGVDVTQQPSHKRNTGMVFQNYALWPHMTVQENVAYGLDVRKVPKEEARKRVEEALETVHLAGMGARFPTQLSGGQQQRVALARVLVINPSVLLLDEPLSNLDAKLRVEMREEIKSLQKRLGITTVYVTHDQEEAMTVSDRVAVQSRGEVRQVGSPTDIYNWPQDAFVATFIGKGTVLKGVAHIAGDGFRMEAGGLTLHCASEYLQDGADAVVVLRPEAFSLQPPKEPYNTIAGEVEWGAFVGPYKEIKLNVGGESILVQVPPDAESEVGTRMTLHIPCRRTILLPPEE